MILQEKTGDSKQVRLNFGRLENFIQVRRMKLVVIKKKKMFIRDGCHRGECNFLRGNRCKLGSKRMMTILKRQPHVLIIMGNIGFVMHDEEFPKGHVFSLRTVFSIMLYQQRQFQHLMKLCRGDQVGSQQCKDDLSFHTTNIQKIRKDSDFLLSGIWSGHKAAVPFRPSISFLLSERVDE